MDRERERDPTWGSCIFILHFRSAERARYSRKKRPPNSREKNEAFLQIQSREKCGAGISAYQSKRTSILDTEPGISSWNGRIHHAGGRERSRYRRREQNWIEGAAIESTKGSEIRRTREAYVPRKIQTR
jgi:hypothetical protein